MEEMDKSLKLLNLRHFWLIFLATALWGASLWPVRHFSEQARQPQEPSSHLSPEKQFLLGKKLNLNLANKREFLALPGIGPMLASRILMDRQEKGPFPSVEALTRVKGIGMKKLEKIRPLVIVRD